MNTKSLRRILIAAVTTLILLSFSVPAYAKAPVHLHWEYDSIDYPIFDCGDFSIIENAHATVANTTFYDKDGVLVREQSQFTYDGTLTNSVTGKLVTDAPDHQTYIFYPDGSLTIHGLVVSINIPGTGVIGLDAGTVQFDPDGNVAFQSGPHHILEDGFYIDYSSVCEVLR